MYKRAPIIRTYATKITSEHDEDNMPVYCSSIGTGEDHEFENIASAADAFDLDAGDIQEALYSGKPLMGHTWGWLM